jgi:predicted CXXCH cytochrome family protein
VTHKPVAEGKCRLCHKPHTSANPRLLKSPGAQSCRPCHVAFFKEIDDAPTRQVHAPARDGACGTCHQVHGGPARLLREGAARERCAGCHPNPKNFHHALTATQLSVGGGEAAKARGCLLCHVPHVSSRQRLLAPETVCKGCHKF